MVTGATGTGGATAAELTADRASLARRMAGATVGAGVGGSAVAEGSSGAVGVAEGSGVSVGVGVRLTKATTGGGKVGAGVSG